MDGLSCIGVDPYLAFSNGISDSGFYVCGIFISLVPGSVGGIGCGHQLVLHTLENSGIGLRWMFVRGGDLDELDKNYDFAWSVERLMGDKETYTLFR